MSQTNGTTKPAAAKSELSNLTVKADAITAETAKGIAPIAERIKRFEELEKLLEKREQISEAIDNLNDFYIAPTGGAQIQLRDSKSNTFAIAHPSVIGEIVAMLKNKLGSELNELDSKFIL